MSGRKGTRVSRSTRVPRALLTGFDGVLRVRDESATAALERAYGVPTGTLETVARDPERLVPALTGQVSDTEWRLSVAAALLDEMGSVERAADLVAAWSEPTGTVDVAVRDALADVRRRGVRIVMVANATTRLETDLTVLGLRSAADGIVSSARVGHVLPDEQVFREAVRAAGVEATECLFVDAVSEHVVAARALGMTGHHFTGAAGLRRALAPVLGLREQGEPNGKVNKAPRGPAEGGGGRLVV